MMLDINQVVETRLAANARRVFAPPDFLMITWIRASQQFTHPVHFVDSP